MSLPFEIALQETEVVLTVIKVFGLGYVTPALYSGLRAYHGRLFLALNRVMFTILSELCLF